MPKRKRSYVQRVRREQREQTRDRIVRALVELHEELGPKNTTIAAVAKRAGVQRLTVYRHFPDETAMLQACSSTWAATNPPPQATEWGHLETPRERLQAGLLALNRYFAEHQRMLAKVYRDASEMKPLAAIVKGFDDYFASLADGLIGELAGKAANENLQSVARHLVRFSTWQSLSREGLSEEQITRVEMEWLNVLAGRG